MVRNVQKMPQESAEEIASVRSGVGFSKLLESTSESQPARKKYNFFKNLLDKTRKGGYNSTR